MVRKKIDNTTKYVVTSIGYAVGGQLDLAQIQAQRAGKLRQDIWNKFGSLQAWGIDADNLYKEFQISNPPESYQLDFKQWQRTFNTVIDDIHMSQAAAISAVELKIYKVFKRPELLKDKKGNLTKKQIHLEEPNFRQELLNSLKSLKWMEYPLIHRWIRTAYHRGHTGVNNQICLGIGNGATIKRKSRNVVTITFSGNKEGKRYQKISIDFKVGRVTPKGNFKILFKESGKCEIHFSVIKNKSKAANTEQIGLDKGFTEGFYGSDNVAYAPNIGKIMTKAVEKRNSKNKARNKLYSIAKNKNKPHIHKCNLGKLKWNNLEKRKKSTLNRVIRTDVNKILDKFGVIITEDLSKPIKGKKYSNKQSRNLAEWCKGNLQKSLDELAVRRTSVVITLGASYTSQVDHRNGTLLGFRSGDQFFTFDGEVIQSDFNAANNIKFRLEDLEISKYTSFQEVHKILIKRTASFLLEMDLTLENAVEKGWLDPKHLSKSKRSKSKAESKCLVA